ncbi:MAG: hypothetical protein ACHQRJ_24080 [Alphaproteobacteria bacterium]
MRRLSYSLFTLAVLALAIIVGAASNAFAAAEAESAIGTWTIVPLQSGSASTLNVAALFAWKINTVTGQTFLCSQIVTKDRIVLGCREVPLLGVYPK